MRRLKENVAVTVEKLPKGKITNMKGFIRIQTKSRTQIRKVNQQ